MKDRLGVVLESEGEPSEEDKNGEENREGMRAPQVGKEGGDESRSVRRKGGGKEREEGLSPLPMCSWRVVSLEFAMAGRDRALLGLVWMECTKSS